MYRNRYEEFRRARLRGNIRIFVCAAILVFTLGALVGEVFDERYEARMCVGGDTQFCKDN